MNNMLKKILYSKYILDKTEIHQIKKKIKELKLEEEKIKKQLLNYEMILNYNSYKEDGFTLEQLQSFYKKDLFIIKTAKEYKKRFNKIKHRMFGYPANMEEKDYIEKYLRNLDDSLPFSNNCGEPYSEENNCNYIMDTKKIEYDIVNLICQNFGLSKEKYEGYITSGGTEGNFYGIKKGIDTYPTGMVYYSEEAHYSIPKFLKLISNKNQSIKISTNKEGSIDTKKLVVTIDKKWNETHNPVIIILTWGTTTTGSIDDVYFIKNYLKSKKIPHYIHLDSAFYGGIPKNQEEAPIIKNLHELDIDSISVSLHKYIGCTLANGIVLGKKDISNNEYISYIGQKDTTISGSRSILPFSTYYRVNRFLNRTNSKKYAKNVNYFQNKLEQYSIPYERSGKGNIFVLDGINKEIATKYQLASLNKTGMYHIIIMPFHTKREINNLISDLKENFNRVKL